LKNILQGPNSLRKSSSGGVRCFKNIHQGLKPAAFNGVIGTDKSVPFQNSGINRVFPQAVKSGVNGGAIAAP
jgi:hypothetical protein